MTLFRGEDGSQYILEGRSDPTFEILTWCNDMEGRLPEQVHLIIEPTPEVRLLYRFTGPVVLSRLIDALVEHRG